jgi:hypothetical protein
MRPFHLLGAIAAVFVLAVVVVRANLHPPAPADRPVPPPEPVVGSYRDLVRSVSPARNHRPRRTTLSCASTLPPVPPEPTEPEVVADAGVARPVNLRADRARADLLDALPLGELLAQATDEELEFEVQNRLGGGRGHDLTPDEQAYLAADDLIGEVENGGFHQYFFNSSGDDVTRARVGFARWAPEVLPLLDCALQAFPGGKPGDRLERAAALEAEWGEGQFKIFTPLDDAFYARPVTLHPAATVRAHPERFPHLAPHPRLRLE